MEPCGQALIHMSCGLELVTSCIHYNALNLFSFVFLAIDLGGCSFLSDFCSWSDKDQGWKTSKSGKGILATSFLFGSLYSGTVNARFLSYAPKWRILSECRTFLVVFFLGIQAHVNGKAAVLESPQILADSIYHTTGLCLSFSYQLPSYSGSSLRAILVSSSNSTIWSLSGYQGSAWLTGQVSFISRENFKVLKL